MKAKDNEELVKALRPVVEPQVKKYNLTYKDVTPIISEFKSRQDLAMSVAQPKVFFKRVTAAGGPVAKKLLIARLRPKLDPIMRKWNVRFDDLRPVLETLTLAELHEALNEPEACLTRLASGLGPIAVKLLLARLRPCLEPSLIKQGLEWNDVILALTLVGPAELQLALDDPEAFLLHLTSAAYASPIAKKMLIARLRPVITPSLKKLGLEFNDVLPALDLIDTVEELEAAVMDVETFLYNLACSLGPAAKRMAIAKLRPRLEVPLAKMLLTWDDIVPVLNEIDSIEELQAALEAPEVLLTKLANLGGTAGRRFIVAKLRPKLEPVIKQAGLLWSEVVDVLLLVDTLEELQAAMGNPEGFLQQLAVTMSSAARRLIIAKLRPLLEARLQRLDVEWRDVQPALEMLTLVELQKALADPQAWLKDAANAVGLAGKRLLIAFLRPRLEPSLRRRGLHWEDVLAALELIDSVQELQRCFDDPESFLESVVQLGGDAAKKVLLSFARSRLEPMIIQQGLLWVDIVRALELIDEPKELQDAVDNPKAFLQCLLDTSGPAAKKVLLARLRPIVEPLINRQGLKWSDVLRALEEFDVVDLDVQKALQSPDEFLEKLANAATPAAMFLILAKMRPKMEPALVSQGLRWDDAVKAFELVNSLDELRAAIADPDGLLDSLATMGTLAAKKMLLARIRPRLEPITSKKGLAWSDVTGALELIDEPSKLERAIAHPSTFWEELADTSGALAKKVLLAKLRPRLEPVTNKVGLVWVDVCHALDACERDVLVEAFIEPEEWYTQLVDGVGLATKRMLIALIRLRVESLLRRGVGLQWSDVAKWLDSSDLDEERLRAILADPKPIVEELRATKGGGSVGGDLSNVATVAHASQITSSVVSPAVDNVELPTTSPTMGTAADGSAAGSVQQASELIGGGGGIFSDISLPDGPSLQSLQDTASAIGDAWMQLGEVLAGPMLRIIISLYQVLKPLGAVFEISYPPFYDDFLAWFSVIEFDFISIDAMPLSCFMRINFMHSLILRTAGPIAVLGLMYLYYRHCHRKAAEKAKLGAIGEVKRYISRADLVGNGGFMLIFLIYPSTCSKIFQAFMCEYFDDDTWYLKADYTIDCSSATYQYAFVPYAFVMMFCYPIGTPLIYASLFWVYRDVLQKLRRDEVLAMNRQNEREVRRQSRDLGRRKRESKLSLQVTTRTIVTEEDTQHPARDALLVLHPNCLAIYHDDVSPVPRFRLWLGEGTNVQLLGLPGSFFIMVEAKSRVDSPENDITVFVRPPDAPAEDAKAQPIEINPTVLMTEWHDALNGELVDAERESNKTIAVALKKTSKSKSSMAEVLKKAAIAHDDLADDRARALARAALPGYFKKIIGPYELRCYWFEIFECIRKISLIGLPVFFNPGTTPQLVLGLLICFVSFGLYMMYSPYVKEKHDYVSQICQLQIFFALLAGVVLNATPTDQEVYTLGVILIALQAVPPFLCAFLASPMSKYLLEREKRAKVLGILGKVHTKLFPQMQLMWARLHGRGKFRKVAPSPPSAPAAATRSPPPSPRFWRKQEDRVGPHQTPLQDLLSPALAPAPASRAAWAAGKALDSFGRRERVQPHAKSAEATLPPNAPSFEPVTPVEPLNPVEPVEEP